MGELLDINVQKTIRKLPMNGVEQMVVLLLKDDGTIGMHSTFEGTDADNETADLLYDGLSIISKDEAINIQLEE